ncbi:TetR/AcrR family transcriptional regulator [Rhodococcus spongiicola]|uniref:TetR/AcrR family transcriptional regulator n=1 Tax=Rhodococcus spongiicola TaxID=2487352 RepID=A0A438B739_9NOCA|nr:TetR/AcrR family transcriptional regulator [Rhodococcus spongiicola]
MILGAVELADQIGADQLTIRRLAAHLGVKPMAIYHHVTNKDEILDGMVDLVFGEMKRPPVEQPWKDAIRVRCQSAREVLRRHPWATPLLDGRSAPGPETIGHHDAVLGCFRRGGFSIRLTAHAYAVVDSYLYGFAIQEASLPATGGDDMRALAEDMIEAFAGAPHLAELTMQHVLQPGYDFRDEFDFGLELVLGGLERALADESSGPL